jgi:VanZ family protein
MFRLATVCLGMYWFIIFVATHLPSTSLPKLGGADKLYHLIAFSGLAFLLAWALPNRFPHRARHLLVVAVIALSYGCLDEFTQQFIPGRHCDVRDIAADAAGVVVGLASYVVARQVLMTQHWGRRLISGLSR